MRISVEEKPIAYQDGFLLARVIDLLGYRYSDSDSEALGEGDVRLLGELEFFLKCSLEWIELCGGVSGKGVVSAKMTAMFDKTSLFREFVLKTTKSREDSSLDGIRKEIEEMSSILGRISERKANAEEVKKIKQFLSSYTDPLLDTLKGMV